MVDGATSVDQILDFVGPLGKAAAKASVGQLESWLKDPQDLEVLAQVLRAGPGITKRALSETSENDEDILLYKKELLTGERVDYRKQPYRFKNGSCGWTFKNMTVGRYLKVLSSMGLLAPETNNPMEFWKGIDEDYIKGRVATTEASLQLNEVMVQHAGKTDLLSKSQQEDELQLENSRGRRKCRFVDLLDLLDFVLYITCRAQLAGEDIKAAVLEVFLGEKWDDSSETKIRLHTHLYPDKLYPDKVANKKCRVSTADLSCAGKTQQKFIQYHLGGARTFRELPLRDN